MAIFYLSAREKLMALVKLCCLGWVALFILFGCNNSFNFKETDLAEVDFDSLFVRTYLVQNGSYQQGYLNGLIRTNQIQLVWYRCYYRDFLSYRIFRDEQLIKTFIDQDSTGFIDTGLTQDTYYNYKIICTLSNGMAMQDTLCLKTPRFLPPTDLYYILAYPDYPNPYTAVLHWTNNAESGGWTSIEKNRVGSELIETFDGWNYLFRDDEIELGVPYRYRVKTVNYYEETAFTEWQDFTFECQNSAPVLDSVQQVFPGTDVKLIWTDNSTVNNNFYIMRTLTSPWAWETVATVGCNVTEWTDTSAKTIGSTYIYYVVAHADCLEGGSWEGCSNDLSITIADSP